MKQDKEQENDIRLKEEELNKSKSQFKQEQLAVLGQKNKLEVELRRFELEKIKFEKEKNEDKRKIMEQHKYIEEEKTKLEQAR